MQVFLLAEVFENYRDTIFLNFKLDPAHFTGCPSLSFNCMLRKTGITLDLFTSVEMADFIVKNIRGGISYIGQRYCEFDDSLESLEETTKCFYSDVNNLCKFLWFYVRKTHF